MQSIVLKQSPYNNYIVAMASTDYTVKLWYVSTSCWTLIRTNIHGWGHTFYVYGLKWINEDTLATC